MGWNDRLFEDPYWPEQNEDRESYENWCEYIESQLNDAENNAGLTSNTLAPEAIKRITQIMSTTDAAQENDNSRQPACNQEEYLDRPTGAAADSQDVQQQHKVP